MFRKVNVEENGEDNMSKKVTNEEVFECIGGKQTLLKIFCIDTVNLIE